MLGEGSLYALMRGPWTALRELQDGVGVQKCQATLECWTSRESLQKLSYNHTTVCVHGLVFPETLETCLRINSPYYPVPRVWYKLVHEQHQLLPVSSFSGGNMLFYQASMCCQIFQLLKSF